jgi:hypothetical protein
VTDPTLDIVPHRPLVESPIDVRFALSPGDRPLVASGETVVVGAPLAERFRDMRLDDAVVPDGIVARPGDRLGAGEARQPGLGGSRRGGPSGEFLYPWRGRWRVASGDLVDPLDAPIAGIVREVVPGTSLTIGAAGRGLRGSAALGEPSRGRLAISTGPDGELRPGGLDVGLAGTILVVGSRVDAETLTRARAMGVRGVIVGGMSGKERRDFLASEARQRAALHRLPPYAVLVLDGALRRPIAGPIMAVLAALEGREVAIVADPPMLVFDEPDLSLASPPADLVRIRGGALAGREGRWAGALGPRRFHGGVHLEAGAVALPDGSTVAVPIGDLERFV